MLYQIVLCRKALRYSSLHKHLLQNNVYFYCDCMNKVIVGLTNKMKDALNPFHHAL